VLAQQIFDLGDLAGDILEAIDRALDYRGVGAIGADAFELSLKLGDHRVGVVAFSCDHFGERLGLA
jgi:hypothetical protein